MSTLVELLRARAASTPDAIAYTFLGEQPDEATDVTYAEIDHRARVIAVRLSAHLEPGARAVLLHPPGLDYVASFLGCLYAGLLPVPAYPPDPTRLGRTLPRLVHVAKSSGAAAVLTTSSILALAGAGILESVAPALAALPWHATDGAPDADLADAWSPPPIAPSSIAFLQYTSGSTRSPRGVALTHENVVANLAQIHLVSGITPTRVTVGWLPPYHDMGLVGMVLSPLPEQGGRAVLMSPMTFLRRPRRWLEALSRFGGTHTAAPDFAYDLCVRTSTPEQRAGLDLSRWEVALSGAEPVRATTIDRFSAAFAAAGFRREAFFPAYGLAEATLIVTAPPRLASPTSSTTRELGPLVSCGTAVPGTVLAIVEPGSLRRCSEGEPGEIWVTGPSVAVGYWNDAEQTDRVFGGRLPDDERRWLRTGDLGFLRDGKLHVAGRLDDVIRRRGRALFPHELEATAGAAHPLVRSGCAAAFALDMDDRSLLCLVAEVRKEADPAPAGEIIRAIQTATHEAHELGFDAIALVPAGAVPKTSSGKIQRYLCRDALRAGSLEALALSGVTRPFGKPGAVP